MKEKKEKSPIVVFAAILFLAIFIVLPPVFRLLYPKEQEVDVVKTVMVCEKISIKESLKAVSKISYENGNAVNNQMTFSKYTPTEEEIATSGDIELTQTIESEMTFLKTVAGVKKDIKDGDVVINVTLDLVKKNPDQVQLNEYLLNADLVVSSFESNDYSCKTVE